MVDAAEEDRALNNEKLGLDESTQYMLRDRQANSLDRDLDQEHRNVLKIGEGVAGDQNGAETAVRSNLEGNWEPTPIGKQHRKDLLKPHQGAGLGDEIVLDAWAKNRDRREQKIGSQKMRMFLPEYSDQEYALGDLKMRKQYADKHYRRKRSAASEVKHTLQPRPEKVKTFTPNYDSNMFFQNMQGIEESVSDPAHAGETGSSVALDSAGNIRVASAKGTRTKYAFIAPFFLISGVLVFFFCERKQTHEKKPLLQAFLL